ncbi:hypothetical protein, partial [Klebsiella pneumoniae]|uniref:hypothetical protein n=1 Tax=Klebsiella pneumoniae TaxID=573 RepID=UPI003F578474
SEAIAFKLSLLRGYPIKDTLFPHNNSLYPNCPQVGFGKNWPEEVKMIVNKKGRNRGLFYSLNLAIIFT